jgi:hypothetical protein
MFTIKIWRVPVSLRKRGPRAGAVQLNDMLTRSGIFIPLWIMYRPHRQLGMVI